MDAQLRTKASNHLIDIIKQDKHECQHGHQCLETEFTIDVDKINPIEHAAAATAIAPHQQRYAIGTSITKLFDDTAYQGTIISVDENEGYYKIVYEVTTVKRSTEWAQSYVSHWMTTHD